jgi:hypothetical protein
MKAARMSGYPIDLFSGIRYYIDDHERGAFELGAPTTDVLDVTGRPAEDFETIARRYATLPRNQRTFTNWLREFTQFIIAPLSPGFDLDRYDRELRRPFPSKPQFAPESKVWRREHGITDLTKSVASVHTKATSAASRTQWLESQYEEFMQSQLSFFVSIADPPVENPDRDIDTVEAEVVFLARQAGQWPEGQALRLTR